METILLGYDTLRSEKGISTGLVTCMLKNRSVNIKIQFKIFEFLKTGNYVFWRKTNSWFLSADKKPSLGQPRNKSWEEQMESLTCLPFQVLFCEDGNWAKDVTDLPRVTVPIYSNYPATQVQNEKWMYFFNPRSHRMDLSHRKYFSTYKQSSNHLELASRIRAVSHPGLLCYIQPLPAFPSPSCSYWSSHLPDFTTSLWPTENTARAIGPCDSLCTVMTLAKGLCPLVNNSGGNRGTGHPKRTSPACQYLDIQSLQILEHTAKLHLILLFVFKT